MTALQNRFIGSAEEMASLPVRHRDDMDG
jgi:hypothetical protein